MDKKTKILYVCSNNNIPGLQCLDWYKALKNALPNGVSMEKNMIETPHAIIDFVYRKPLFALKYDCVLNADRQGDDALLLARAIGEGNWIKIIRSFRDYTGSLSFGLETLLPKTGEQKLHG